MTEQVTIQSELAASHSQKNVRLNFSAMPLARIAKRLPALCVVEITEIVVIAISKLGTCRGYRTQRPQPLTAGLRWKISTFPVGRLGEHLDFLPRNQPFCAD
jgi:hypothetical protein